jgi:hypothetical protein
MQLTYQEGYEDGRKYEREKAKRVLGTDYLVWHDSPKHIDLSHVVLTDVANEQEERRDLHEKYDMILEHFNEYRDDYKSNAEYCRNAGRLFGVSEHVIKWVIYKWKK